MAASTTHLLPGSFHRSLSPLWTPEMPVAAWGSPDVGCFSLGQTKVLPLALLLTLVSSG